MKRTIGTGLAGLFALTLAVAGCSTPASQPTTSSSPSTSASATAPTTEATTRVMQDMLGDVVVPAEAQRIATTAPAFTTSVLLLGGADKLVALEENYGKNEWVKGKYPQLADLPVVFASNETNMEALLATSPDLVLYAARYGEDTLKQLQDLEVSAVSGAKDSQPEGYDHLNWVRDNQVYMGEAIGGAQLDNAKSYAEEFTAMREQLAAKTEGLPEGDRPSVAQLSSAGEVLQANNGTAIGQELIELAGGVNVAIDADGESMGPSGQTKIEPEQLLAWNPQILLVDSQEIADAIAADSVLSALDAVANNQVYVIPNGAMSWAYNGPEVYLAMQFFAKAVQPELFADLDLQANTSDFYATRFGFELTDADLAHLFNLADGQSVADVFTRG
ncbi:ABC transporter substrate-binding protein [Tessaracoccus caeni]|uniref:ABC transporter substrate-binding protein n=1 Tax=Tessaracoccus caeni TaxID=3031239 RepID=UPI0023DCBB05|nr:ABC transporter substrate-binding protein [Tessaracoccus caeni]MDF1487617.1 ABC transporter substrate-binding protein [Tessaracoccus caeni]